MKLLQIRLLHYRIAFGFITLFLFLILTMIPFTIASVMDDFIGPLSGPVFTILPEPATPAAPSYSRVHIGLIELDEFKQIARMRLSGHHVCQAGCSWNDQIEFLAFSPYTTLHGGPPLSTTVTLPADNVRVTQLIEMPIYGNPIRYPFDNYELVFGVILHHVSADGTVQTLSPAAAAGQLALTIQEQLPRHNMEPPVAVALAGEEAASPYLLTVQRVQISRPFYMRVLAISVLLLVTVAAAYAVFMRPLNELVVNAGALVLGVWGIRGILVPGSYYGLTAMDLTLSMVLILLLGAITVRAVMFLYQRAQLPGRPGGAGPFTGPLPE
jgi:hypothetical protein